MQADKIEKLEKDHGWHEEQFDFILQFMRTLLLKRKYSSQYQLRSGSNRNRRRIVDLHHPVPRKLLAEPNTLLPRHTLSPKKTVPQAQRDRPGQDPGSLELGFLGQDPNHP